MKLEAVIICVDYSDFLSNTLPYNKSMFDRMVVVTDKKDSKTKAVCEFWNVECVQTDDFYLDGPMPNKARGINKGLEKLSKTDWVVQLDADIWLPPLTRHILQKQKLDKNCIYGIDRLMCENYEDWYNFLHINCKPIHEGWVYLHLDQFKIGTRIVQYHGEGYMPIGYFQLWHPEGSGVKSYPVEKAGYDRTDVVHLKQFTGDNRRFIPEIVCIHLSSETHAAGQNWFGRKTQLFRPKFHKDTKLRKFINKIKKFFNNIVKLYKQLKTDIKNYFDLGYKKSVE